MSYATASSGRNKQTHHHKLFSSDLNRRDWDCTAVRRVLPAGRTPPHRTVRADSIPAAGASKTNSKRTPQYEYSIDACLVRRPPLNPLSGHSPTAHLHRCMHGAMGDLNVDEGTYCTVLCDVLCCSVQHVGQQLRTHTVQHTKHNRSWKNIRLIF